MNLGSSNRINMDNCAYQKRLYESTSPMAYQLYFGKYESCSRCKYDKLYTRYDLVDIEPELRNQNRPLSKCDQFKYNPDCKKSGLCLSTFDKSVPVTFLPDICPIVYNNLPRYQSVGFRIPSNWDQNPCNIGQ